MGAAGAFYLQVFQYIDPAHRLRAGHSVEALVGAIVGGLGTLWGPLLGALVLHRWPKPRATCSAQLPGMNMVIYGVVLVLIVMFVPRGMSGVGRSVRALWRSARDG